MSGLEIVASPLLQVVFETLFQKLRSTGFVSSSEFSGEVQMIEADLRMIQGVLADAENRQMEDKVVKVWMDDVRNVVYDLEDILDVINTRQQGRTCNLIKDALFRRNTIVEIREAGRQLNQFCQRITYLGLQNRIIGESSSEARGQERLQRETMSEVNLSETFGRDEEKQKLIEKVIKSPSGSQKLHVISVVGMGGIGKTTLVQLVYNSKEVKSHFDFMVWVHVSRHFQFQRIMEAILRQLDGEVRGTGIRLEEIKNKIKEKITDKKLLVVLDDVWKTNPQLDNMLKLFREISEKTMVIITSRKMEVASHWCRDDEVVPLDTLSNEICRQIFEQHAFANKDVEARRKLEPIGLKIVEKCRGLPLAARSLGALLHDKASDYEWKYVLNSRLWELDEDESEILTALKLSYNDLPSHLKRCFVYCAIFPKGYEFKERELALMWMAQDFLKKQTIDEGYLYFRQLLSRSFFQQSSDVELKYVMHDCIHDLAQWVGGETRFQYKVEEKQAKVKEALKFICSARYASYTHGQYDDTEKVKTFDEMTKLRALVDVGSFFNLKDLPFTAVDTLFSKLHHLRVFSFRHNHNIIRIPDSVGGLRQLRYLNFSNTSIKLISESICSLNNLEVILLQNCYKLKELPKKLCKLVKLRHLDIYGSTNIKEMPHGMGKLKWLQTLSNFSVGNDPRNGIQELDTLQDLQGSLLISNLENVTRSEYAKKANMKNKTKLKSLSMIWNIDLESSKIADEVLEELEPSHNLEELTINVFPGTKYSTWMGDSHFSSMISITLKNCPNCMSLPSLGRLPSLQNLCIDSLSSIVYVDEEFYGKTNPDAFPSLKRLKFVVMKNWENWTIPNGGDGMKAFSSLQNLCIEYCPKLVQKLSRQFRELECLKITNCDMLEVSIPSTSKLQTIWINGCKRMVCSNSVDLSSCDFRVFNIEGFEILREGSSQEEVKLSKTSLKHISLSKCHELKELPCRVRHLELENCSFTELPSELYAMSSTFILTIRDCCNLKSLADKLHFPEDNGSNTVTLDVSIRNCEVMRDVPVNMMLGSKLLVKITITSCNSLTTFVREALPITLKALDIRDCAKLQMLVEESIYSNDITCSSKPLLELLSVRDCPSLKCLASTTGGELPFRFKELHISDCENLASLLQTSSPSGLVFPAELENMSFDKCPNLKKVAERFHCNSCHLQLLSFKACKSLKSLPEGIEHLNSLRRLSISDCENLDAPTKEIKGLMSTSCSSLEELHVLEWPAGITSLLNEGFQINNNSLRKLVITYPKRETISKPISEWGLSKLISLTELSFQGYKASDEAFLTKGQESALPSSLTELNIQSFPLLKSFPTFQNLSSLEELHIAKCPKLKSLPTFQNLTSLKTLRIYECLELDSLPKFQNLNCLQVLVIVKCPKLESLPDFQNLTSLETLWIVNWPKLKSLPDFQNLTSLQELLILNCPKLESLPDFQNLTSLQGLVIGKCPKLKSLPKGRLPPSLEELMISKCPLLEKRCKPYKGKDWPKISHIPDIDLESGSDGDSDIESGFSRRLEIFNLSNAIPAVQDLMAAFLA